MAFKMKNPSMTKMAKQAGSGSPMKNDPKLKKADPKPNEKRRSCDETYERERVCNENRALS